MDIEEFAKKIEEKVNKINDGNDMLTFEHISNEFPSGVSYMFNDFIVKPNTSVSQFNNRYSFSFSKNVMNSRLNGVNVKNDILSLIIKKDGNMDEMLGDTEFADYEFDLFIESFRDGLLDVNQWGHKKKLLIEKGYILYDNIKPKIMNIVKDKPYEYDCSIVAEQDRWYLYKRNSPYPLLILSKSVKGFHSNTEIYIYDDSTFKVLDYAKVGHNNLSKLESHDINELYSIL